MAFDISSDPSASDLKEFIIAAIGVEVFMIVFFLMNKVYDMSTALFFAFLLGTLVRGRLALFHLLFLPACLNRETTILVTGFFAVYYFARMPKFQYVLSLIYQGLVFLGTRWFVLQRFARNEGQTFYFQPARILHAYLVFWPLTLLLLVGLILAGVVIFRHWDHKPIFLRSAFLVLFPVLLVLHLTLGIPFEIRVFAEIFPVAWALCWTGRKDFATGQKNRTVRYAVSQLRRGSAYPSGNAGGPIWSRRPRAMP